VDEFSNGYDIFEQVTHKAEPVAWIKNRNSLCFSIETKEVMLRDGWEPLYLAPAKREWVGLTDEERSELANKYKHIETGWYHDMDLIAESEAKLKEKNGG
jgi:hypothetical protein